MLSKGWSAIQRDGISEGSAAANLPPTEKLRSALRIFLPFVRFFEPGPGPVPSHRFRGARVADIPRAWVLRVGGQCSGSFLRPKGTRGEGLTRQPVWARQQCFLSRHPHLLFWGDVLSKGRPVAGPLRQIVQKGPDGMIDISNPWAEDMGLLCSPSASFLSGPDAVFCVNQTDIRRMTFGHFDSPRN